MIADRGTCSRLTVSEVVRDPVRLAYVYWWVAKTVAAWYASDPDAITPMPLLRAVSTLSNCRPKVVECAATVAGAASGKTETLSRAGVDELGSRGDRNGLHHRVTNP